MACPNCLSGKGAIVGKLTSVHGAVGKYKGYDVIITRLCLMCHHRWTEVRHKEET